MFEEISGLFISFDFPNQTTTLRYMPIENLREEYGVNWGESCLIELEPSDRLNKLIGQTIQSIKVGQFKKSKLRGGNFIIPANEYAGVVIQTISESIAFYARKDEGQILFDTDKLPQSAQSWTLE